MTPLPALIAPSILAADFACLGNEVKRVIAAGVDGSRFYPEGGRPRRLHAATDACRRGCQAGLVLNPATPLDVLPWGIDKVDLVPIMRVNPGFGGPSVIPAALQKLAAAGADTCVAGSAIFGQPDDQTVIDAMRAELSIYHPGSNR